MSLGELPSRTTMRGYYKCENANDSSGNGRTLTNIGGSGTFVAGKFTNCFYAGAGGTSGRGLGTTTNIMSALKIPTYTFSCWIKFNNTANITGLRDIMEINTIGNSTGSQSIIGYTITSGALTILFAQVLTTTNASISYLPASLPSTTEWISIIGVKTGTTTVNLYINGTLIGSHTGTGTETSAAGTYRFIVGNNTSLTQQVQDLLIDEVIVEERAWSASEIRKYYTQAKGRLLITQ